MATPHSPVHRVIREPTSCSERLLLLLLLSTLTPYAKREELSQPRCCPRPAAHAGLRHWRAQAVGRNETYLFPRLPGTSMGAVIGGCNAAGYTADDIEKIALDAGLAEHPE